MAKEKRIIKLSDRTHVLKRPGRYIGSINEDVFHRPILENDKIVFKEVRYVPALLKIFREIVDNSVDNFIKNKSKNSTIKIYVDEERISIEDNGTGIPVQNIHDEYGNEIDKYAPEAVWTELKTGENFDDEEDNTSIGQNGEGSTLTNIFSKKFIGTTCDGKKHFVLTCENNMEKIDTEVTEKKCKRGTKVEFWPDFNLLECDKIDEKYQNLILFELIFLSATYPDIDFIFNGSKIDIKSFSQIFKKYFENDIITTSTDNITLGIAKSEDGYQFIHFINGINVFDGGKVLNTIENKILNKLIDKLIRKYPNIKINDIKNKITFISIITDMQNPRFANQIKSECINQIKTLPEISAQLDEISNSKFIDKIYKSKELMTPILDLFKLKQLLKDKKDLQKEVKKIKSPAKYWKAAKEQKYFVISEGDSAIGSIINGVGRDYYGFMPIRGKIPNVIKDESSIKKHKELLEIAQILGITFDENQDKLNYENIVIATDMDVDGNHITSLIIGYLLIVIPEYLKAKKVQRFLTPLLIAYKHNEIYKIFFDFDELRVSVENNELKNCELDYKKGLGSLTEEEWEYLFEKYSFEDLLLPLEIKDEIDIEMIFNWLGDERAYRKEKIMQELSSFDINFI